MLEPRLPRFCTIFILFYINGPNFLWAFVLHGPAQHKKSILDRDMGRRLNALDWHGMNFVLLTRNWMGRSFSYLNRAMPAARLVSFTYYCADSLISYWAVVLGQLLWALWPCTSTFARSHLLKQIADLHRKREPREKRIINKTPHRSPSKQIICCK